MMDERAANVVRTRHHVGFRPPTLHPKGERLLDWRNRIGLYAPYFCGMAGIGFTLPYLLLTLLAVATALLALTHGLLLVGLLVLLFAENGV